MAITCIQDQLVRDEGVRLFRYSDSRGFDTIGVGHNLDANPLPYDISNGISRALAMQILNEDLARLTPQLYGRLPWLRSLDPVRQGVFQNMDFNMGVGGVLEFHHDLADTQAGNYLQAAADMKASLWYVQVGARAQRLAQQMITGFWQ